jgi:hypothetical protein
MEFIEASSMTLSAGRRPVHKWLSHAKNAITAAPLAYRPGHYHSPICEPREISQRYSDQVASPPKEIPGIDLRTTDQLARWQSWKAFLPIGLSVWRRYSSNNRFYSLGDAIPLHCFLRELRPKRVIEIGCGFSSACVLDTIEAFSLSTVCTFMDPDMSRVKGKQDNLHTFMEMQIQDAPLTLFDSLVAGDILLIDSTHIVKTGSDVVFELFEILPRLKPGVMIHFHDIFHPFEYPREWAIERNYSWNEAYALRAFLSYNSVFRVEFWNHYIAKSLPDARLLHGGASLWISRT